MTDQGDVRMDRGGRLSELAAPQAGYLFEGRVARVHAPGDALRYPWGEEHRDAAELAIIAAQLPGKPVAAQFGNVVLHPSDLLKKGAPHKVVGHIVSARVDGDHVVAKIFVTDPGTIKAIREDGIDELSLGYACRTDENKYQRDTYVDHLSVVPRARCGATCALRADAAADPDGMRTDCGGTCTCQTDAVLHAKERAAIPATEFADPKTRQEPLEDAGHVRDAMARFGETHFPSPEEKRAAFHRITADAKRFGIDTSGFEKTHHTDGDQGTVCKPLANSPGMRQGAINMADHDELAKTLTSALTDAAAQKARADQAEKDRDSHKARADQAEKDLDAATKAKDAAELASREAAKDAKASQARVDAAEATSKAAEAASQARLDAAFDARVAQRVEILANANAVLGAADKDGKPIDRSKVTDLDLMKQVAKRVDGDDAILDTDLEPEVRVAYRGALKRYDRAAGSRANVRQTVVQARKDNAIQPRRSARDEERAAHDQMLSDSAGAWNR